jgi:peptidoglycan/xylan/chitin deacetylase (PgdA/CDA1 family)
MAYQGNEIASHTWSHRSLPSIGAGAITADANRTARKIEKTIGVRPTLLRPPYGAMGPGVLKALGRAGQAAILWDVDTRDWQHRSGSQVLAHVKHDTHRGSIILMHDLHAASADALDAIIDLLEDRGYTLVTVSELLGSKARPGKAYHSGPR